MVAANREAANGRIKGELHALPDIMVYWVWKWRPFMSLTINLDLPKEIEQQLRAESRDIEVEVKEAYALELFRQGRLSHYELSQVLGLDRFETDGYLKRHNVFEGSLTMEDLEADRRTLDELFKKKR